MVKEKLQWIVDTVGPFLATLGSAIFLLTFWLPKGDFLGGDAYFLGPYLASLEIILPYAGMGIFIAFFGHFLSGKKLNFSSGQIIVSLLVLAALSSTALFSINPETSILFSIIWATGIVGASVSDNFRIRGAENRVLYFLGVLAGMIALYLQPEWDISPELLGMAALLGVIFIIQEESFPGRIVFSLFYVWVIFQSSQVWLMVLSIIIFAFAKLWAPPSREKDQSRPLIIPLLMLFGLLIWGLLSSRFSLSNAPSSYFDFFQHWTDWIFGIGPGQFFVALETHSPIFLIPEKLVVPESGLLLAFWETGIIGVLAVICLFIHPLFFYGRRHVLPFLLFLSFWIFSAHLFGTENGILWATVMLIGRRESGIKKE